MSPAQFGTGLEPGEVRLFAPGDRVRHINWPASLRLGRLYVTQFHQERSADVVLLLDTLAETGASPDSSLDASVRAVAALASAYIARKDRVGLVEFGGYLRWLKPAAGRRQLERLLRAAVPAAQVFSYMARSLDYVPATALPRQALVIAVSPLIDERFTRTIVDLAGRGYDVVLLAVSAVELTRRALPDTAVRDVACALWKLELAARVQQLRHQGITVVEWQPEQPLDTALASLARRAPVRRASHEVARSHEPPRAWPRHPRSRGRAALGGDVLARRSRRAGGRRCRHHCDTAGVSFAGDRRGCPCALSSLALALRDFVVVGQHARGGFLRDWLCCCWPMARIVANASKAPRRRRPTGGAAWRGGWGAARSRWQLRPSSPFSRRWWQLSLPQAWASFVAGIGILTTFAAAVAFAWSNMED